MLYCDQSEDFMLQVKCLLSLYLQVHVMLMRQSCKSTNNRKYSKKWRNIRLVYSEQVFSVSIY